MSLLKIILPVALLGALVYVGYNSSTGSCVFTELMGGETQTVAASSGDYKAPAWELDKVGESGKLASTELKGKVAVLNFWATWCPPCVAEIPHFITIQEVYKDKGVQFVGLSVDRGSSAVKSFIKQKGVNYPVVMADQDVVSKFGGVRAIPTTFILDGEGNILESRKGYIAEDDLKAMLDKALAKN